MILRVIWKNYEKILKRNEGFDYRILETETRKVLQGFCHLLSITKSLILSAICHLESGIVVINGTLNVNAIISFYIRLPKALCGYSFPVRARKPSFHVA